MLESISIKSTHMEKMNFNVKEDNSKYVLCAMNYILEYSTDFQGSNKC